jgi:hypothetical protein
MRSMTLILLGPLLPAACATTRQLDNDVST